jgi:hypothetical protein
MNLGGLVVAAREGGTAERRKRSGAEGDEESERLVVADEAGEPTRGTPWREGGAGPRDRWRER